MDENEPTEVLILPAEKLKKIEETIIAPLRYYRVPATKKPIIADEPLITPIEKG